ncbi:MAG: TetR/AcrR family transcriptional regulator [Arenicella sp.]|nr:TetR/AcrR family transcriptional regulator [Arenicella sp.]
MPNNSGARGPYKSGLKKQKLIIESAVDLLIDEGYHNFSLRKVSQRAGISGGNLQHHFKTKEDLLEAMLDSLISVYLETFKALSEGQIPPKERLRKILEHVILDLNSKSTTLIFPELWSLSNHDKRVSKSVDKMYERYRAVLKDCVAKINPKLSTLQIEKVALFMSASIEGHTIFIGYKRNWTHHTKSIIEMAYTSFLFLIESGNIPE